MGGYCGIVNAPVVICELPKLCVCRSVYCVLCLLSVDVCFWTLY